MPQSAKKSFKDFDQKDEDEEHVSGKI